MSLFICSLNSGSNGNCYYIASETEAVLVDVGISCKEVEKRMERSGLSLKKVKAIFISHEHSDHIKGVRVLSKKYNLPVYITARTHASSGLFIADQLLRSFSAYQAIAVGELQVTAFPKLHDCAEPHSFVVSGRGVTIGIFTDIGRPCHHVINNFKLCHAIFLEANYDETMLEEGQYPWYLKNRIRSGHGHLSNRQALELFNSHRPGFMSHVLLSHLSRDNNHPSLAKELFLEHAGETEIVVASRDCETEVFEIRPDKTTYSATTHPPSRVAERSEPSEIVKIPAYTAIQTTLF